jgi:membrane protein
MKEIGLLLKMKNVKCVLSLLVKIFSFLRNLWNPYFKAAGFIALIHFLGWLFNCILSLPADFFKGPPSYGALASTTAIVVASIFPVAVHVKEKKESLLYFDNKINMVVSQANDRGDGDISSAINEFRDDIISEFRSINAEMWIFGFISIVPSLVSSLLFFHWGGMKLFVSGQEAVASHMMIFSLLCMLISVVYIGEYRTMFYRHSAIFLCVNIIKNNSILDRVKEKVKYFEVKKKNAEIKDECKVFKDGRGINGLFFLGFKHLVRRIIFEISGSKDVLLLKYFTILFVINTVVSPVLFLMLGTTYKIGRVDLKTTSILYILICIATFLLASAISYLASNYKNMKTLLICSLFLITCLLCFFLGFALPLFILFCVLWYIILTCFDTVIYRHFIYWSIMRRVGILFKIFLYLVFKIFFTYITIPILYMLYWGELLLPGNMFLNLENANMWLHGTVENKYSIMFNVLASFLPMAIAGFLYYRSQYKEMKAIMPQLECNKDCHKKIDEIFEKHKEIDDLFNASFCYFIIKDASYKKELKDYLL